MEKQLKDLGLEYGFVSAVDGSTLSQEEMDVAYDKNATKDFFNSRKLGLRKYIDTELAPTEIGCALSHLKIYQEIAAMDDCVGLIMEDDVSIREELRDFLSYIHLFPIDWEIVFLGCISRKTFLKKSPPPPMPLYLMGEFKQPAGVHEVFGGYGYMINSNSARKLLDMAQPLHKPIDLYIGDDNSFNVYIFEPHLILHKYTFSSTILSGEKAYDWSKEKTEYGLWVKYFSWIKRFPNVLDSLVKIRLIRTVLRLYTSVLYRLLKFFCFIRLANDRSKR